MIDIQKLKQFPLAFKAFEGYIEKEHGSVLFIYNGSGIVKNEDFLLFLDGVGFIANPHIDEKYGIWTDSVISVKGNIVSFLWMSDYSSENRMESTELSILKAFELLENKLKTN